MSIPAPSAVTAQITANTTRLPPLPTPTSNLQNPQQQPHTPHDLHLAQQVAHNLQYQHDWSDLKLYTHGPITLSRSMRSSSSAKSPPSTPGAPPTADSMTASPTTQNIFLLPRPVITGVPPRPVYIHPDTQLALIKRSIREDECSPEETVVLPTRLAETVTLQMLSEVFDALPGVQGIVLPASASPSAAPVEGVSAALAAGEGRSAGGGKRRMLRNGEVKRLLLATVDDDSSVSYYVVHDGVVKPRQN